MKVTTSNPVIIDDVKVDPIDMYLPAEGSIEESYQAGDVKVSTMNPVIIDETEVSPKDYYSNLGGVTGSAAEQMQNISQNAPSLEAQVNAKKKGKFWNKAKGAWEKISNSPASQFALQQLANYLAQKQGGGQETFTPQNQPTTTSTPVEEQKMKLGTKIAIGVGAALVIGLIIYAVASNDSKGKTSK